MINPLNELSSVYMQNIAEGCGCDDKEDKKKECNSSPEGKDCPSHGKKMCPPVVLKGSSSVDGGDTAKPGKDKNYVKPMATESASTMKAGREFYKKQKEEGSMDYESPRTKAKKKAEVKEHVSWRDEIREVTYGMNVANRENATTMKPQNSDDSRKEIKEKKVKNKIKINPPQSVTEGFGELGAVVVEMYELTEADMTGAPSIKDAKPAKKTNVKYDSKMKVMAPQINKEETEEEKKKRELQAKTKEHDDKMAGKLAEQSGGGMAKLGPRESGKRKDKGKKKPQAIRQSKARLAALKRRLNSEELSIKDQMRISREAAKNRNPNPDHRKINAMKASNQKKDNRTDAQKMSDATGPRPGSNYRGD